LASCFCVAFVGEGGAAGYPRRSKKPAFHPLSEEGERTGKESTGDDGDIGGDCVWAALALDLGIEIGWMGRADDILGLDEGMGDRWRREVMRFHPLSVHLYTGRDK